MPAYRDSPQTFQKLGRFLIERELGRGAFGVVYLAHDPQLERKVALKIPSLKISGSQSQIKRFLREAKAAAGLHHPSIVAVHDAGQIGEYYYIASNFVDGHSLRTLIKQQGKPSHVVAARLIARLSDALRYAHEMGVIHRDVKPDNILVDNRGNPYLVDFGLARRNIEDVLHTQDGTVLGTPAYMSPEQASGSISSIDGRSDQWSLGVIFYELLVGERPFQGDSMQIMYAIQYETIANPRKLDPSIPHDLATICMRCLAKEPKDRFDSCADLALDLERWLRDEPILSRRHSIAEQLRRWSRRNPTSARLAATLLLSILILGSLIGYQWNRAESSLQKATENYDLATRRSLELNDTNEALRASERELQANNLALQQAKDDIERQKENLQAQLLQIREKDSRLQETTLRKSEAEQAQKLAEDKSERELQKRRTEELKNQKLRYVGDIAGVRAAMDNGQTSVAMDLLLQTQNEMRSLEWTLCKSSIEYSTANYEFIDNQSDFQYLRNVSFPNNAIEPNQIDQILETQNIIAVSSDAKRWIHVSGGEDILNGHLPQDYNNNSPPGPRNPDLRAKYSASLVSVQTLDSSAMKFESPMIDAWLSPDGRYAVCLQVHAESAETNPLKTTIRILRSLHLYDLQSGAIQQGVQTKIADLPEDRFTVQRGSTSPANGVYSVDFQADEPPQISACFSQDSSRFLAIQKNGDIAMWDTYQATVTPIARAASILPSSKHTAIRFSETEILLASPNRFHVLAKNNLEFKESRECPWPIDTPEHTLFSRDGSLLGLVQGSQLSFYSLRREKWFDCPLKDADVASCRSFYQPLSSPQVRREYAKTQGVLFAHRDGTKPELVEASNESWVTLQLGSLGVFPFVYQRRSTAENSGAVTLRKSHLGKPPDCLALDNSGNICCCSMGGRLLVFRKNRGASWSTMLDRIVASDRILDLKPQSDGVIWMVTSDGLSRIDASSGTITPFVLPSRPTVCDKIDNGRLAYGTEDGRVCIASSESGETIAEFQAQRGRLKTVAFDSRENYFVAGGEDWNFFFCDTTTGKGKRAGFVDVPTKTLDLNRQSSFLVQLGQDNQAYVYRWPSLKLMYTVSLSSKAPLYAGMSFDGKRLIVVDKRGMYFLEPEYGLIVWEAVRFESEVIQSVLNSDQSVLIAACKDGSILAYPFQLQ
jgi:serine/threonine protein kinase